MHYFLVFSFFAGSTILEFNKYNTATMCLHAGPKSYGQSQEKFISLAEASKGSPYSQEYLSLLARRGKLDAKKIGRNWYTTKESLNKYLAEQGLQIIIPKSSSSADSRKKRVVIGNRSAFYCPSCQSR